jgi:hypothetical protein
MTAIQLTQQNIFKTVRVLAAMTATIWLTQQNIIRKPHVIGSHDRNTVSSSEHHQKTARVLAAMTETQLTS